MFLSDHNHDYGWITTGKTQHKTMSLLIALSSALSNGVSALEIESELEDRLQSWLRIKRMFTFKNASSTSSRDFDFIDVLRLKKIIEVINDGMIAL